MIKFPDGFLWGTSSSGLQSESVEVGDGQGMNNGIIGSNKNQKESKIGLVLKKY
ncbi:hypothetical protein [Fundicoccus culcitae]|uniref:Glycosyl hydrolase family protein n=1 Tax=Fundicoccus culcitae TaxID=2969821 RepID=A0ABY5P372_9LACT|nr:hypothetical protein [Fundicoccus culcitae]UUX33109.1 hypothetical protein NRE15_09345 [Fundicoccus culcitae]